MNCTNCCRKMPTLAYISKTETLCQVCYNPSNTDLSIKSMLADFIRPSNDMDVFLNSFLIQLDKYKKIKNLHHHY